MVIASGSPDRLWLGLIALIVAWVAYRLGALHLFETVVLGDGQRARLVDTFATVDHPFHVARAESLRRALADGHPLRWIGHHQGGYPAEFYPLGAAWLDVIVWALFLGALPIAAVHKLVVVLVFVLPGIAYALMARRDQWPLGVAVLALAAHVAVPGGWWHGGYRELVEWGLVTNVTASVALLFVLLMLTRFLASGARADGALAAIGAAFAISSNPRSLVALAVIGVGTTFAMASARQVAGAGRGVLPGRLALVAALTALLAAPVLVPLLRFEDLYYFVRYEAYDSPDEYLRSSIEAVSRPVFLLAIAGLVVGWSTTDRLVTRAVAMTLALYVMVTALLSFGPGNDGIFQQLETTRLMPFQRLLTIYLAAVALQAALAWAAARLPRTRSTASAVDAVQLAAVAAILVYFVAAPFGLPDPERGLYKVETSAAPALADFNAAIDEADAAAPPGTAVLVLGSLLSWHEQLWAPLRLERPFYYDDWLWYWQTRHAGPFDPLVEHSFPSGRVATSLEREYLDRHGIGAVVIADTSRIGAVNEVASRSPELTRVRSGLYDVYRVRMPTPLVTFVGDAPIALDVRNQRIEAAGSSGGGEARIRHNWYPRWRATVNGQAVPIAQTDDGYMSVPVPAGDVRLELLYSVDRIDWAARAAFGGGLAFAAWFVLGDRLRWRRRSGFRPKAQSGRR